MALGLGLDDVVAEPVEGLDDDTAARFACARDDAFLHLAARLVRKRQAEDFLRLRAFLLQDIRDAAGQRIRLARTGRR